jgi:hypothetical protein
MLQCKSVVIMAQIGPVLFMHELATFELGSDSPKGVSILAAAQIDNCNFVSLLTPHHISPTLNPITDFEVKGKYRTQEEKFTDESID